MGKELRTDEYVGGIVAAGIGRTDAGWRGAGRLVVFLCSCLFASPLFSGSLHIESSSAAVNAEGAVLLHVVVKHKKGEVVDKNSFRYDDQPVPAKLLGESKNGGQVVATYELTLPPLPYGLQVLAPLSVKVGREYLRSANSTLSLSPPTPSQELLIEQLVDPVGDLYVGEEAQVGYRIYFSRDIDLIHEELPLLSLQGVKRIGSPQVREYETSQYSVHEVTQRVEPLHAGTVTVPGAKIMGRAYKGSLAGRKVYENPPLRASTNPFQLSILDFPGQGKPKYFTGAVGEITLSAELNSPPNIKLGESVEVTYRIVGTQGVEKVELPDLRDYPGYAGFFQVEEWPPRESRDGKQKEYTLRLRPLSSRLTAIPPLRIAYFDPRSGQYRHVSSSALELEVEPIAVEKEVAVVGTRDPGWAEVEKRVENLQLVGEETGLTIGEKRTDDLPKLYEISAQELYARPPSLDLLWAGAALALFLLGTQLFIAGALRGARNG